MLMCLAYMYMIYWLVNINGYFPINALLRYSVITIILSNLHSLPYRYVWPSRDMATEGNYRGVGDHHGVSKSSLSLFK